MTSPSDPGLDLSAAAQFYAERGWPVFPLVPRDKRPLTTNGFKAASTDPDIVKAWWQHWPNANIGIATGFAFDVLDVDGQVGVDFLKVWWERRGITYAHTGPVVSTGKGWHYLFATTGFRSGANLGGDAEHPSRIDFRGVGGYVVAPPSIHPLGHRYAFRRGPDSPLPEAPGWLADLVADQNRGDALPGATKTLLIRADHRPYLESLRAILPDQLPRGIRTKLERPDILQVAEEIGLQIKRRGRIHYVCCPYHHEKTPSMALYVADNTFHCFGCQVHGDSIDLRHGTHL